MKPTSSKKSPFLQDDFTQNTTQDDDIGFTSITSELILDEAVNRLFDDANRRKELKERFQLISAKKELEGLRQQPEINKKSN